MLLVIFSVFAMSYNMQPSYIGRVTTVPPSHTGNSKTKKRRKIKIGESGMPVFSVEKVKGQGHRTCHLQTLVSVLGRKKCCYTLA